jgi:hypothetical protein
LIPAIDPSLEAETNHFKLGMDGVSIVELNGNSERIPRGLLEQGGNPGLSGLRD